MKPVESYRPCEFCGGHLSDNGPPPPRAYERGEIHICAASVVLLPKAVVEANRVNGYADSHCANIDGHYCNLDCLIGQIRKVLRRKPPKGRKP